LKLKKLKNKMTQTTARIKREGKHFEVIVDMEEALKFRRGNGQVILETDKIFLNAKKGDLASREDLEKLFETTDVQKIAEIIVKRGEIEETQEHRSAEHEMKFKQIVDFFVRNAIDPQSGNPLTPERIKNALEQSHIQIKNASVESQVPEIFDKLSRILPIKIETKKIKITIPAIYTGHAYGLVQQYKQSEDWKDNGDLEVVVKIPAGIILDFYDKLNSTTHGSVLTEEMKE